jgi:hypothetical protein
VRRKAYLEPLFPAAIAALVVACALVHPYHNGALLMRPLRPYGLDLPTRSNLSDEIGRCATVAHDLFVGNSHGGVVVGPLTLNGLGRRGRRKPSVSMARLLATTMVKGYAIGARCLPWVCYAIDHVACHCPMSGGLGDKQGGGGEDVREQHLEGIPMSVVSISLRRVSCVLYICSPL